MKIKYLLFFIALIVTGLSQVQAQKILVFDKRGKVKRVRYYQGELIKFKLLSGELITGEIGLLTDSSFEVNSRIIKLDSVKRVYNTQKLYGFKIVGTILTTAGMVYFPLDSFNRIINNDQPTLNANSALVSGIFLGTGLICIGISNKSYKISEKRPLKVLDLGL